MKTITFITVLVSLVWVDSLQAQNKPAYQHEFRAGINRAHITTGEESRPAFYNQYLLGLTHRWGLLGTVSFLHVADFPETNLDERPGFPYAYFSSDNYNVSDLEPRLNHYTMIWMDLAPQFRAVIGEKHQFGISIGPSIGYFHYSWIQNLEIGTFISPIRTADITLVEYVHTRGIDIGGHGRMTYDFYAREHLTLGAQASANIFANGDYIYNIGINAGVRL